MGQIITVPFGWLIAQLYQLTSNYGLALIIFAVLVKIILFPVTAKSKRSTMKMSRLSPRVQALQKKYENDPQKQNEEMRKLYQEEGVSMGGGCLWSLVPLLILLPLYTVIREPITYILQVSGETAAGIVELIKNAAPEGTFSSNVYYDQIVAATLIPQYTQQIQAAYPDISQLALQGINFGFLGIDLGITPNFNIFAWEVYNWATFGAFLVPVLSAGSQVLSMFISTKMNNSVITDEKGLQDKETAKNSQANQTSKTMMWIMPLMSLWIGFTVPCALSLYWLLQGVISTVMDIYLTKKYRKIYDEEDAARLKKALEEEALEAEKERARAQRRAANPDGITENTSKKKLQQMKQKEQEAAKREAAKEYAASKGVVIEESEGPAPMSGIADRPYCKGRNYDPNRYASNTTEE